MGFSIREVGGKKCEEKDRQDGVGYERVHASWKRNLLTPEDDMSRTDFLALTDLVIPNDGERLLDYFNRCIALGMATSKDISYMCESYGMTVLSFELTYSHY